MTTYCAKRLHEICDFGLGGCGSARRRKASWCGQGSGCMRDVKHSKQLRGWGGGGQVHGGCFTAVKQARPSGFIPCVRACVRALMICAA